MVVPIIRRYLEEYETATDNRGNSGAITILAKDAGMSASTFMSMLTRRKTLSFNNVDRLLCAMDQPWLWYEWPLLVFYFSAEAPLVCAHPRCTSEFRPAHGYKVKFCLGHRNMRGQRVRQQSRDKFRDKDGQWVKHVVKHGTRYEYRNFGCRCDKCTRAYHDYFRAYNARRAA